MCVQMAQYSSAFTSPVAFPPSQQSNGLSEVVSKLGLSQFHVAETAEPTLTLTLTPNPNPNP